MARWWLFPEFLGRLWNWRIYYANKFQFWLHLHVDTSNLLLLCSTRIFHLRIDAISRILFQLTPDDASTQFASTWRHARSTHTPSTSNNNQQEPTRCNNVVTNSQHFPILNKSVENNSSWATWFPSQNIGIDCNWLFPLKNKEQQLSTQTVWNSQGLVQNGLTTFKCIDYM